MEVKKSMLEKTSVSITSYKTYKYYRKITGKSDLLPGKDWIAKRDIFGVVYKELINSIITHYIENEAGVYISHMGYLCHIINPNVKYK